MTLRSVGIELDVEVVVRRLGEGFEQHVVVLADDLRDFRRERLALGDRMLLARKSSARFLKCSEPCLWLLSLPEVITGFGRPRAFAALATAMMTGAIAGCRLEILTASLLTPTPCRAAIARPSIVPPSLSAESDIISVVAIGSPSMMAKALMIATSPVSDTVPRNRFMSSMRAITRRRLPA